MTDTDNLTLPVETWMDVYELADRERKEVEFSVLYATQFAHGTTGHNQYILIDHMNDILSSLFEANDALLSENEALREGNQSLYKMMVDSGFKFDATGAATVDVENHDTTPSDTVS